MKTLSVAERPPAVDKNDWRYFTIKTGAVKAFKRKDQDADGKEVERYIIAGTASSSVKDLYGDILTEVCQASMLAQADGLTMWLNHSYKVPEDIAGVCINPQLKHATAEDGTPCIDLEIELEIDPENPRAFKSWQHVSRGTQLAFSIGGFFTEYELVFEDEDDWWGHFEVDNINLLEISLVGIPANPRAYTKTFENARAAVVAAAEAIAAGAAAQSIAQRRIEVRKSFGLPGELKEKSIDMKCAHANGCENQRAADSEFCKIHRAAPRAETVQLSGAGVMLVKDGTNADGSQTAVQCSHEPACETYDAHEQKSAPTTDTPAETPEVKSATDDTDTQSKIVEAMKSVVKCVNSPGHQMCIEPQAQASTALSILKSALPDDYDLPEDAELAAPPATVVLTLSPERIEEFKALWATELAKSGQVFVVTEDTKALKDDIEKLTGDKTQLSADVETLQTEKTTLEQEIAQLKATPLGRSTKSSAGGSSNGSESITTPEMYKRTSTEMTEAASRSMNGAAQDARSTAQATLPTV